MAHWPDQTLLRMLQPIVSFDQDDDGHWRALLACGHRQHVRHQPPLVARPWVLTAEGRHSRVGQVLECARCEAAAGDGAGSAKSAPPT